MSGVWSLLLLLVHVAVSQSISDQGGGDDVYKTVMTVYGSVRGKVDSTHAVAVEKYYGIPFAKPPVGPLRFQAPVAPDMWTGVRDALQFGGQCVQRELPPEYSNIQTATTSEDCLYLNVYVPEVGQSGPASLPVMVWIHGGGFASGSGSQYDATTLSAKGEVIVVTINYRLDLFGFMSTEDDVMPGNYGMLDQVSALKWVQDNIAAFGGNPNLVTIFGESAGAGSVSLLTVSPLARGLFQRAIMESGSCLSQWAVAHKGFNVSPRMAARLISVQVGCDDIDDSNALLSCLQQTDPVMLLNASLKIEQALETATTPFMSPRVETTFRFLPDVPASLLSYGPFNHVDTLRGFNTDETGVMVPFFTLGMSLSNTTTTKEIADALLASPLVRFDDLEKGKLLQVLTSTYISASGDSDVSSQEVVDALDDYTFIAPTITELNYVATRSPQKKHYLYEFNYRARAFWSTQPQWMAAIHAQDLQFVFGLYLTDPADISVSNQIIAMWTQFAKTGDPTISASNGGATWNQYSPSVPNYLFISDKTEQRVWSRPQVVNFWHRVLESMDGNSINLDQIIG